MKGKIIKFEQEDYAALDQLARDRMMTFRELADEAFRDLLQKHGRPTDLKDALRRSVKQSSSTNQGAKPRSRARRR